MAAILSLASISCPSKCWYSIPRLAFSLFLLAARAAPPSSRGCLVQAADACSPALRARWETRSHTVPGPRATRVFAAHGSPVKIRLCPPKEDTVRSFLRCSTPLSTLTFLLSALPPSRCKHLDHPQHGKSRDLSPPFRDHEINQSSDGSHNHNTSHHQSSSFGNSPSG